MFGITGGDDQYLIELSYQGIFQFKPDFTKVVVLLSEKMTSYETFTFKIRSDVTSI